MNTANDPQGSAVRVLLADDHPVVRAGLKAMLDMCEGIDVAGQADTAQRAVGMVKAQEGEYDVVLMDLRFGDTPHSRDSEALDGVWATKHIRALPRAPQVLVVTNYSTDSDVLGAVSAGAVGYLLKDCSPEELERGVKNAAKGQTVMSHRVMDTLVGHMHKSTVTLTARETEVLERAAMGESNRQIAKALVLTEATVKSHLGNIFTKLEVSNRTAAVNTAREQGLI